MTEECKQQEEKKCNCECKDLFTKLAIATTGSFVGCLLALCVFTTFTKPQIPPMYGPYPPAKTQFENKNHPRQGNFKHHKTYHPKLDKKDFKGDWEGKRPDRPDNFRKVNRQATPEKK